MTEPVTTTIFGYKPSMIAFAIFGSAISLQFAKKLTWWQGVFTVASGFLVSVVAVPGYFEYCIMKAKKATLPLPEYTAGFENAVSFFTAMFAMALIATVFTTLEKLDLPAKINKLMDKKLGL